MAQWFCVISWRLFDVWTSYFRIKGQYDLTFDLKIKFYEGLCDLYFVIQWLCLISPRLFDAWVLYFQIMRQCDPNFDLKVNISQHDLYYAPPPESGGVLCYTLRNFECTSVCLSVCPSVRPSAPTTILVSATPPTVLGQSFWNFTGVLRMVWRYAYCFFRILKLFFITFFPFLT